MVSVEEAIDCLAFVLSCGHALRFNEDAMERRIARSPYFIALENGLEHPALYQNAETVARDIFFDARPADFEFRTFNQSLWLAELYLRIQAQTKMTFEGIFLYLPVHTGYEMFPLYHEMDFSQAIDAFLSLTKKQTPLSVAMKKTGMSISSLSQKCGLSYSMVFALKNEKKDIRKVAAANYLAIVSALRLRPETLIHGA